MYMYIYMNPTCRLRYKLDKILFKAHRYSNVVVCSKNFVVRYQCTLGTRKTRNFVLFTPIRKRWRVIHCLKIIHRKRYMTSFMCVDYRAVT